MNLDTIDTLARTLYGEARGEPRRGKIAVAWVIRNRAIRPGWWGRGIIEVCLKPSQFSCWNANDPNRPKLTAVTVDSPSFLRCYASAAGVLADVHEDPTNGATYYYADYIDRPGWARDMAETVRIGRHIFLKEN